MPPTANGWAGQTEAGLLDFLGKGPRGKEEDLPCQEKARICHTCEGMGQRALLPCGNRGAAQLGQGSKDGT